MHDETPQADPQLAATEGQPDPAGAGQPAGSSPRFDREDLSIGLIGLGCALMLIMISRMLFRRGRRRGAGAHAAANTRAAAAPVTASGAAHDRLERLMADAEELTRRLAAVLENRAARIEVLLEQADERLAALETATPAAPTADAPRTPAPPAGFSLTDTTPTTDPLHRKVYDLADRGLTPVDIARQIDRPTGQIELILALRRA